MSNVFSDRCQLVACLSVSVFPRSFRSHLSIKYAPAKCAYGAFLPLAFHAKPVRAMSTIVLVARIRLLGILEVITQLRRRCHRCRFHRYWIFPRCSKSIRRNMRMDREAFDDLLRLLKTQS